MTKRIYFCFSRFSKGRDVSRSLDALSDNPANKNMSIYTFAKSSSQTPSRRGKDLEQRCAGSKKTWQLPGSIHSSLLPAQLTGSRSPGALSREGARGVEAGPSEQPMSSEIQRWRQ